MYKVLVVDDEPMILEGFDHIIVWEEFGLEIVNKSKSGYEALKYIEQNPVDIIISDIKMPEMDGTQLLSEIRAKKLNTKVIILSGYDEFKYIKKAIRLGIENYLLKPIEETELSDTLINTIEKLNKEKEERTRRDEGLNILKENILYRWVTATISEDELIDKAEFLDINLETDYFLVSLVKTFTKEKSIGKVLLRRKIETLKGLLVKEIKHISSAYAFHTLEGHFAIVFCWNDDILNILDLDEKFNQVLANYKDVINLELFLSIGSIVKGFKYISESYYSALKLIDYHLIMSPNSAISLNGIENHSEGNAGRFDVNFNEFIFLIKRGDFAGAKKIIKNTFLKLKDDKFIKPEYIRYLTLEFIISISDCIIEQLKETKHWDEYTYESLQNLLFEMDLSGISDRLSIYVDEIMKQNESFLLSINPVAISVLEYVDKHFDSDISIKVLADKYNINPAYLGQMFKKTTGEFFSDYLNKARINKAKDILINTNLKISEISKSTGFSNTNYFSNQFKKITGYNPSEFRNSNIQEKLKGHTNE